MQGMSQMAALHLILALRGNNVATLQSLVCSEKTVVFGQPMGCLEHNLMTTD